MTYKIKFNFLMSLSRKQRRGNVNKVLKNELEKRKKQRRLSRAAAKKTPLHPMDPLYRQQMQIMATYGSTMTPSTALAAVQEPPSTTNSNIGNTGVAISTIKANTAGSMPQFSSVPNPVPEKSIIVMPNANESEKKSKDKGETARKEVLASKNEEIKLVPSSTKKSLPAKQAAPPPYLQD
mmetsp:Transcript_21535/g.30172  ORF Transcript_21535/g.30172 Transcript_21535/m.30172 type:complete len:180 (+) Transcript_21535:103-642(+)